MEFQSKSEVRQYVKSQKPAILPLMGVLKHLSQFLDHQTGFWAAYKSLADEPAIEGCLGAGIQWFYPRLDSGSLKFVKPQAWRVSDLKFHEPMDGTVMEVEKLNGFLIPGQAFSKAGVRVGRGKGFYDRALKKAKGLKVGICYSYQIFSELPVEDHDVLMDVLVSDQGITWLKRERLGD